MRSSTVDPIGSTRIDDIRDPYRMERLQAQLRADRMAPAQAPPFPPIQAVRPPASVIASRQDPGESITTLRDQYTAHCLRNAIQAFHDQQARLDARAIAVNQALRDEQTTLQVRAAAANDLGTIQGLLPQQPYRYAAGVATILAQPLALAASVAQGAVGPVNPAAKSRGSTDHAFSAAPTYRGPRRDGA